MSKPILNVRWPCRTAVAFAVIDAATGAVVGSTSYHDIVPALDRVEIGYTWYAKSRQRSHVNTTCKLLLLTHAFETLGCAVVGWRTDNFNFASQKAIERLGAKKDGVISPPRGTARRQYPRYRHVQPAARRMARGENAAAIHLSRHS